VSLSLDSRRRAARSLARDHPGAAVVDVTSRGDEPWIALSPFYPHGDIPVPFSPGVTSMSVEGIWQALKVFEHADVDPSKLTISSMKGLKRTVRRNGPVLGHREGLTGRRLLTYVEARRRIYLPSYRWVLDNKVPALIEQLRARAKEQDVVLLDFTTNDDVDDTSSPLSHAALVKRWIDGTWPS
jgi:hypothetical protein